MTVFWIVVVLLVLASLLFLLPPLLLDAKIEDAVKRKSVNIAIRNDKLAELKTDLNSAVITEEQYEAACKDLDRSLLQDVAGDEDEVVTVESSNSKMAAVVLGICLPMASIIMYNQIGGGIAVFNPQDTSLGVSAEGHEGTIEGMISGLQQRLEANPADIEGWVMLGRSYYFQKRHKEASDAYEKALQLSGENNPDLMADLADTLAVANNRSMLGRPTELVKKALSLKPYHQKALWLSGTAAYQAGDFGSALGHWQKLLTIFPPGSEQATQVENIIEDAKQQMASRGMAVPAQQAAAAPATGSTGISGGAKVSGTVTLSAAFKAKAAPTDTVFIFARAASGPRMPLAILRKQVKDLPVNFTLDDSMAMNPAMKLSNFPDVVVGARISKSGNAMPSSGDIMGQSPVVSLGTTEIPLEINSVVP